MAGASASESTAFERSLAGGRSCTCPAGGLLTTLPVPNTLSTGPFGRATEHIGHKCFNAYQTGARAAAPRRNGDSGRRSSSGFHRDKPARFLACR